MSCVIKRRYRIVIYLLETFFHPIFIQALAILIDNRQSIYLV